MRCAWWSTSCSRWWLWCRSRSEWWRDSPRTMFSCNWLKHGVEWLEVCGLWGWLEYSFLRLESRAITDSTGLPLTAQGVQEAVSDIIWCNIVKVTQYCPYTVFTSVMGWVCRASRMGVWESNNGRISAWKNLNPLNVKRKRPYSNNLLMVLAN